MKFRLLAIIPAFFLTLSGIAVADGPGEDPGVSGERNSLFGLNQFTHRVLPPVCDTNGLVWNLTASAGTLTGTVDSNLCGGVRNVTGSFNSSGGVSLHADNATGSPPACCGFTYTGTANKASRSASGTWQNDVPPCSGGSGTWTAFLC